MFDGSGRRKYLNGPERRACLDAFNSEANEAFRGFGLTLLYTGCRISEALALTAQAIDRSQGCLVFETLKRRRHGIFRAVPIPESLIHLLRQLTAGLAPVAPLWNFSRATGYRMIKERMAEARIEGAMASPKGLRHGFAIACIAQNIPLPTVQKWMGHARLETTAIYLGVGGDEERDFARRLWLPPNPYQNSYQKSARSFAHPPKIGSGMMLRDEQWRRVGSCLSQQGSVGRPRTDDRRAFDAILYVLTTGCRWQDLPEEYGDSMTTWRRLKLWMEDGSLLKAWRHVLGGLPVEELACQNAGFS